jgi:hypothetical protein
MQPYDRSCRSFISTTALLIGSVVVSQEFEEESGAGCCARSKGSGIQIEPNTDREDGCDEDLECVQSDVS